MAIFEPAVQATETITEAGHHTFEHGLGTLDVLVELFDADHETLPGPAYSLWNSDTVRVHVPAGTKLPATLRVIG